MWRSKKLIVCTVSANLILETQLIRAPCSKNKLHDLKVTGSDDVRRNCFLHDRLIADIQHFAANTEGPNPPEKLLSVLSFLVESVTVVSTVQSLSR